MSSPLVFECTDDLVDDFLADLPPPTNAAMAALPAAIGMLLSTRTKHLGQPG